ncbi:TetR/AcrR family transcriptional regulator [Geodermatophilus sp. SYSU D00758]
MSEPRPYHHGDLRRELLRQAADMVAADGVAQVSLRELARRAGVSHAAPAHHFGDKRGLLTALAVEGYTLLAERLAGVAQETGDFLEVGVAYVSFATEHPAHFEVMYRPGLYDADDSAVTAARGRAAAALYGGAATRLPGADDPAVRTAGLAAWSLVHGFASLWNSGALPTGLGPDPAAAARQVAAVLFTGRSRHRSRDDEE